jgi:hypothetical protein
VGRFFIFASVLAVFAIVILAGIAFISQALCDRFGHKPEDWCGIKRCSRCGKGLDSK